MRPIPVGAKGTFTLRVTPAHLANQFKDAMLPPVFATPMMITAMENAALNAIRGYLDPGESAVGTAVDVRHLAATPVGHEVTAEAEVTSVHATKPVCQLMIKVTRQTGETVLEGEAWCYTFGRRVDRVSNP